MGTGNLSFREYISFFLYWKAGSKSVQKLLTSFLLFDQLFLFVNVLFYVFKEDNFIPCLQWVTRDTNLVRLHMNTSRKTDFLENENESNLSWDFRTDKLLFEIEFPQSDLMRHTKSHFTLMLVALELRSGRRLMVVLNTTWVAD